MSKSNQVFPLSVVVLLLLATLLGACATGPAPAPAPVKSDSAKAEPAASSKPAAAPTQAPETAPSKAAPAATASEKPAPAPPAPKPAQPQVGGTLVYAVQALPASFDIQSVAALVPPVAHYLASSLVARDPTTGDFVPFLAESWKVSGDGLTYEFKLKKNVKWHDGTPFTAKDYVYTIQRGKDPATKWPIANSMYGAISSAEAPDDYTLILKLTQPDAAFLILKALLRMYSQPVPKHAIEKLGDKFGTAPMLSGPFRLKEFQMGQKVVLERNPDYSWGPPYQPGPPYLQNVEFRLIKEYATILAGLESGEIDLAEVQPKDVERLKATGTLHLEGFLLAGQDPGVFMNVSKVPWDDIRVRKAVNLAIDRQAMVKVVTGGTGEEQKGPLSRTVFGYWPGVEKIGYGFDLNQAKEMMKEAGYTLGSGGTLERDGKPLKVALKVWGFEPYVRVGQLVQAQLRALGIDLEIEQGPMNEVDQEVQRGNYDLAVMRVGLGPDADFFLPNYDSSRIGTVNRHRVADPGLDKLIAAQKVTLDTAKRLEILADAQKLMVEKAYTVPLYTPKKFYAVSNRVKGLILNNYTDIFATLETAYIEGGR